MPVYISLLRGINISGQKKIKMADLKALLHTKGFAEITTYLQSGNLVYQAAATDPKHLSGLISAAIQEEYGFEVPVLTFLAADFARMAKTNPFVGWADEGQLHVTLLDALPDTALAADLVEFDAGDDRFKIIGAAIYLHCPNGYGRTKLNNNFFERKLKTNATTRNWKTVAALVSLAAKI